MNDYIDRVSLTGAKFELALAKGNWQEAIATCESYIHLLRGPGYRWGWARRLIDLGDALTGRDQPGDRERGQQVYQQSLEMFSEMGAPGYIGMLNLRLANLAN